MMLLLYVGLVVAFISAAFIFLFRSLASRVDPEASTAEWLDSFSLESYAPMERLLDQSDFEFLASQPGYKPEIAKRLLAERREAFTGYLQLLTQDFNQLLAIAKLMLVYSDRDQPGFAQALWRQQVTFYYGVCVLRCRVALYPLGWTGVDIGKLVRPLESMHLQLQQLAQIAEPV